jgi:hypothetical protein
MRNEGNIEWMVFYEGCFGKIDDKVRGQKKKEKKIWTISRFMRVILAQGPC